jgi:hypothetical protein
MSKPLSFHQALLRRRTILDLLRKLAGALPPAPSAHEALEAIEDQRDLALSVCLNELASPSTVLRHAVAATLRHLDAQEASLEVEEIAEDPRVPDENRIIARELYRELRPARMPSPNAFPIPTPGRPSIAYQLLDMLEEDSSARSNFLGAWSAAPVDTRVSSVAGLAETRDPRILSLLEAAALDREARVAEAAMRALSEIPDPRAREILDELASGSRGSVVRRIAGRFLLNLEPDPPGAKVKAAHCVAGPIDVRGERDLLLAAPRPGGARWDLLRVRLSVRKGIVAVETRPNLPAASATAAATALVNDGGFMSPGPSYGRDLIEDALAAPEAGPNRLGPWRSLLGSRPLAPRPYRVPGRPPQDEAKSSLRNAERLLRGPEFRGWLTPDPDLDHLREDVHLAQAVTEGDAMERFFHEFLLPRRPTVLRSLELTRDLFMRRGDRGSAKVVAAAEWGLVEGEATAVAADPLFQALVRRRLVASANEPASSY